MVIRMDMLSNYTDCAEIEVSPGASVFMSVDLVPEGTPHGIFCPWDELTSEQKERFQAVHERMEQLADELKSMFKDVPAGPEPGYFW